MACSKMCTIFSYKFKKFLHKTYFTQGVSNEVTFVTTEEPKRNYIQSTVKTIMQYRTQKEQNSRRVITTFISQIFLSTKSFYIGAFLTWAIGN
jgi:hypothetical protein